MKLITKSQGLKKWSVNSSYFIRRKLNKHFSISFFFFFFTKSYQAVKYWVKCGSGITLTHHCRIKNIHPSRLRVSSRGRWQTWFLFKHRVFSLPRLLRRRERKQRRGKGRKQQKWQDTLRASLHVRASVCVTFSLSSSAFRCRGRWRCRCKRTPLAVARCLLRLGCSEPSLHAVPFRLASVWCAGGCASLSFCALHPQIP